MHIQGEVPLYISEEMHILHIQQYQSVHCISDSNNENFLDAETSQLPQKEKKRTFIGSPKREKTYRMENKRIVSEGMDLFLLIILYYITNLRTMK